MDKCGEKVGKNNGIVGGALEGGGGGDLEH